MVIAGKTLAKKIAEKRTIKVDIEDCRDGR